MSPIKSEFIAFDRQMPRIPGKFPLPRTPCCFCSTLSCKQDLKYVGTFFNKIMTPPKTIFAHFVLFCVSFLCYSNSLLCGFAFDDASAIVGNRDLHNSTPILDLFKHDFWGTPLDKEQSHKSYRPLTVLTFRFNYFLHELSPAGYHLINVLLHCCVVSMFYEVLQRLFDDFSLTFDTKFATAVLFAVHPIHVEAVTGLVGRAELLSALFYLSSLLTFVKFRQSFCAVFLICLGTFCKEQAVTAVGVCIVWHFLREVNDGGRKQPVLSPSRVIGYLKNNWESLTVASFGFATILTFRFIALRGALPYFTEYDNPAASATFPERQLTYNYLLALNSWLCLCPSNLCADWTMGTVPLVSIYDCRLAFIATFWACFFGFVYFSRHSRELPLKIALILLAFPFLPASNLFFPVGFVVAERVLYLPSMGYCLLLAYGWQKSLTKFSTYSNLIRILMWICCFVFATKTFGRNFDWKNEYSLFVSGLKITQNNAKIFNNVGHALESENRSVEALPYFVKATQIQPDDLGSWMNVGRVYMTMNKIKEAETYFLTAKGLLPKFISADSSTTTVHRVAPAHLNVFINLGEVYKNQSRFLDAERMYKTALKMRPDFVSAYMNLGDLLLRQNRTDEALNIFQAGLEKEPKSPDLLYDTGIAYLKLGNSVEALKRFENALSLEPDHVMSLINSALLMEEISKSNDRNHETALYDKRLALSRLRRASELRSSDAHLFLELGNLQYEIELYDEALKSFKRSLSLDSTSKVAMQNLALVEIHLGFIVDAVNTLNGLLAIAPDSVRALLTLCDLYSNQLKNLTAAEFCYQRILTLEPSHIQARHNLCIILINGNKRNDAAVCIRNAKLLIAENGPYTLDLFKILQKKFSANFPN